MLRKFRLDLRDKYESRVLAFKLSEMIESLITVVPGAVAIGSEQGCIEHWDDIVALYPDGLYEHTQVKRQGTQFCNHLPLRLAATAALSSLDCAFLSLAQWSDSVGSKSVSERRFVLTLFGPDVQIKRGLRVDHLLEIASLCAQESTSWQQIAERNDGPTRAVFSWLTTWCGFRDWEHIHLVLSRVSISFALAENNLETEIERMLARYFETPDDARAALLAYMFDQTSDVGAIQSRALLQHLRHLLRPEVASWTQYRKNSQVSNWTVSGTHGLRDETPEAPIDVVTGLWDQGAKHKVLRVVAPHNSVDATKLALPHAVLRMAIHLRGGTQCLITGAEAWRTVASSALGGTLGNATSDVGDLPWLEFPEQASVSMRTLVGPVESNAEAEALMQAMDDVLFAQLVDRTNRAIENVHDTDLLLRLHQLWGVWRELLSLNPLARREFFSGLLHPATEGLAQGSLLRVGPRALDLLTSAVMTLLSIAISIGGEDSRWDEITDCGGVLSIALKQWSGPVGAGDGKRGMDSDDLFDIIGAAPPPVVVLSGVDAPASSFLDTNMAETPYDATSLIARRRPKILVTNYRLDRIIYRGTLSSVQEHFSREWQLQASAKEEAIANIESGAGYHA
jgi:ABC-3C protein